MIESVTGLSYWQQNLKSYQMENNNATHIPTMQTTNIIKLNHIKINYFKFQNHANNGFFRKYNN